MNLRAALIFLVLGFLGLLLVRGAASFVRWAVPARAAGRKGTRAVHSGHQPVIVGMAADPKPQDALRKL